jgi:hypothetical protein
MASRRADPAQCRRDGVAGERVADPHPGQAEGLAQRSHDDQVGIAVDKGSDGNA